MKLRNQKGEYFWQPGKIAADKNISTQKKYKQYQFTARRYKRRDNIERWQKTKAGILLWKFFLISVSKVYFVNKNVISITISDNKGKTRKLDF